MLVDVRETISPVYSNTVSPEPDQEPRQIPPTSSTNSDWEIISFGYHPERQPNREVLNSLAYILGFRASIERHKQGGVHQPAFYRAGLFEKSLENALENHPSQVADLVCLPDILLVDFKKSGGRFNIDSIYKQGRLLNYTSSLNMRDGTLTYNYMWADENDKRTEVSITQLVSRADPNIVALKYSFTPQNYSGRVTLETGINAAVDNKGISYLAEVERGQIEENQGVYCAVGTVPSRNHLVSIASKIQLLIDGERINPNPEVTEGPEQISQRVSIEVEPGHTYTLEKTVAVTTSRDGWIKNPVIDSQKILLATPSFKDLYKDHAAAWEQIWRQSEIEIEGDDKILQALRFNMYKLAQMGQSIDSKANIGAKGLDNMPGEGYLGHAFWDTELFMLPYFIHTNPEVAKNLLIYRYNNLQAAQEKASGLGYEGALYPWESADNGKEETPERVIGADGRIIEILTGRHEFHISADIAMGVWQYYLATGDEEFMRDYGVEIIAETARFWASKAIADSKDATDGKFHIKGVVGPDEYHEGRNQYYLEDGQVKVIKIPGVNDSFYNNSMAVSNLLLALELRKKFAADPTILDKMGISDEDENIWRDIAENMSIVFDPKTKIIEQFAGYHNLKTADLKDPKYLKNGIRRHDMDNAHKENGEDPWDYQTIKQADVVQALLNLGNRLAKLKAFEGEDLAHIFRVNRDFYEKRTSHGSSLSDSMHVLAATYAGIENNAYQHLLDALFIDLNDKKGNNGIGTHAAALGGGWQAIVYGFGGVRLEDDQLSLNPKLIENWKGLKFPVRFRGQQLLVQIRSNSVEITAAPNQQKNEIALEVYGQKYALKSGEVLQIQRSPEELALTA